MNSSSAAPKAYIPEKWSDVKIQRQFRVKGRIEPWQHKPKKEKHLNTHV